MVITGPWLLSAIQDAGWDYGIARIPAIKGPDGTYNQPLAFIGVQGFMVSAFSDNKTIAMDFLLNYVATTEVMADMANAGNRIPTFIPAIDLAPADLAYFADQAAFGLPMPSIPEMDQVWQEGGNAIDLINNGTDAATALQQAYDLIIAAIGCE
jgi:maltose-binding protein MalE